MKRTVWTFGLIGGAVSALLMVLAEVFANRIGFEKGMIVGYTNIVLASLLVFFGIRSYRDTVGGGAITFGRGTAVGLLIALIIGVSYALTWEVIYFGFMHDFCDNYTAYQVKKIQAAGGDAAAVAKVREQMAHMKQLMNNPMTNFFMALIEPLPVSVVIALISATILRRSTPVRAATTV